MRLGMKLQHANHGEINPVRPVVSAFNKKRSRLAEAKQLSLWKTPSELNLRVFTEGSLQVQEMWKETAEKHIEMSAEVEKNFLDLFKQQDNK